MRDPSRRQRLMRTVLLATTVLALVLASSARAELSAGVFPNPDNPGQSFVEALAQVPGPGGVTLEITRAGGAARHGVSPVRPPSST